MNKEAASQSVPPLPVGRNHKRPRLSNPRPITGTHLSQLARPVTPPPLRKPWHIRLKKDDVVSLEERIRHLTQLLDDTDENTAKAKRRVDELRYGAGSLAKIHVTESLRTCVTQEEYAKARDEEIRREIHRDQHRKISGGIGRFSEPPRLLGIPESRTEKNGRVSMGIVGCDIEAIGRSTGERFAKMQTARDKTSRDQAGKDKVAKEQAAKDRYAGRRQVAKGEMPRGYSEKRMGEPKTNKKSRAPEDVPDLKPRKTRDQLTLRVQIEKRNRQGHEEHESQTKKARVPK